MRKPLHKMIGCLLILGMMMCSLSVQALAASSDIGELAPAIEEGATFGLLNDKQGSDSGNNNQDGYLAYFVTSESADTIEINGNTIQWNLSYETAKRGISTHPYCVDGWVITGTANFSCRVDGTDAVSIVSYPTSFGTTGSQQFPSDHKVV